MDLHAQTARDIADGVKAKKFTARQVVESSLADIKKKNGALNAYITVAEDYALNAATRYILDNRPRPLTPRPWSR